MGKLPSKDLRKILSCIRKDPRVIIPPQLGFDSGVHLLDGDKCLIVSTDPCISVPEEWFGWLLIHYVASDIALFGAKMQFCSLNLLGMPSTKPKVFYKIMRQACETANKLDITIVTGHTGTYDNLSTIIGVCSGYGYIDKSRLITPSGAKPGDYIVCIKPIGLETIVNFALTHKELAEKLFGSKRTKEISKLVTLQSCVKEALELAKVKGVHAMHDATEGGLTVALNEITEASNLGFKVEWDRLLIPDEVRILADLFELSEKQILSLSSTGTFLVAVSPDFIRKVEIILSKIGVKGRIIGSFSKDLHRILVKDLKEKKFPREVDDPYIKILFKNNFV